LHLGTAKWYSGYGLTSLGAEQNFAVGSSYRERYLESTSEHQILGISEDEYKSSQIYASAPDQSVLMNTATAFLQGLYPPLGDVAPDVASTTLNDGTNSTSPLDGYQYVVLHGIADNSPDTIWIKGDDACPLYKNASKAFESSEVFAARDEATRDFYNGFYDILAKGVYNIKPENMTYKNAYNIFDLINVARIHNESSAALDVSDEDMLQLRTLADSAELGLNWNATQPDRAIGAQTLMGAVVSQLNETIATSGKLKFSLFAGSYDTFLAFFGMAGLLDVSPDFYGLPDYASTMSFELFTEDDVDEFPEDPDASLRVRWLFRNGTDGELTNFPLFGSGEDDLPWTQFKSEMDNIAISDVGTWCERCGAEEEDFCAAYATHDGGDEDVEASGNRGGMSNAVAGVIGAMVTLGVVAIAGGIAFVVVRKRRTAGSAAVAAPVTERTGEKGSIRSGSTNTDYAAV
jgi:prostatic aicd phosphatase